jgi:hypothetical protein
MASGTTAPPPAGNLKRIVAASLIGTTIEWYDFFLYGSAAALVFNKLFFPDSGRWVRWCSGTTATGSGARSSWC